MKKISLLIIVLSVFCCKNENSKTEKSDSIDTIYVDSLYTLNSDFKIGDVRRYGVEPGKGIGQHPKLLKDKLDVLLDISESGIELFFPKGIYNRTFNIEDRTGVKMQSDSACFTGAINIKSSKDIKIGGVVETLTNFYVRNATNIDVNTIISKTDTVTKGKNLRSTGCEIHSGCSNIHIKKVLIEDSGSGSEDYKYIKGAFIIHGHNNEPFNIKVDSVIVKSSDRHGAYITGENIDIKYLDVKKFGVGSANYMNPMEGGIDGEQKEFAGLWIKNCHDCFIDEAVIDVKNSKGKYSINFDIGEEFRPTTIQKVTIKNAGSNRDITKRIFSRTGVVTLDVVEE